MKITELPVSCLCQASWNPNRMDAKMIERLGESLSRYGLVDPLVVRPRDSSSYEVLSGNQRLKVIKNIGFDTVPCILVNLNDSEAMLLAQALNGLHGEDDLALKGALLRNVLASIPEGKVLSLLPETTESLKSLSSISEINLAEHLQAWERAQAMRLNHMQLQLTSQQLEVVDEAISQILPNARDLKHSSPNQRGIAIYLLCRFYLDNREPE
jgi:ParB family chromosome partitioning protein